MSLPLMKSAIVLLTLAAAALTALCWMEMRPQTALQKVTITADSPREALDKLVALNPGIPGVVVTNNRKIDKLGRHVVEVKFPDGHTEWSVDIEAQLAASK
jgi:hypothetical protein